MSETCPNCGAGLWYDFLHGRLDIVRCKNHCGYVRTAIQLIDDLRRQLAAMTASCHEAQEQAAKLLTDVDMLTADRNGLQKDVNDLNNLLQEEILLTEVIHAAMAKREQP